METKTQIENGTEALNKAHVCRSAFEIHDTAWKTFDEENVKVEKIGNTYSLTVGGKKRK